MRRKLYSFVVRDTIDQKLPKVIRDAMAICGWDAPGIYELVLDELEKERKANKVLALGK